MLIPFMVILLAHVIAGDAGHPQDLCDVCICTAVVGQQYNPCTVDLAGTFVPVGHIGGQALVFIWGSFDLDAFPGHLPSFRREDAKENSKLKDFFERPLSRV
jgi:hypothetical protein